MKEYYKNWKAGEVVIVDRNTDIGSIFPLYESQINGFQKEDDNRVTTEWRDLFSLCREALYVLGKEIDSKNRTVLIPAYTCSTVYQPFRQRGWSCYFYNINCDLTIDTTDLMKKYKDYNADVCLIHPYYGMSFTKIEEYAIECLHNKGCIIIEDLTQSIFSRINDSADYTVGSLRKWFPIPDGAFLINHNSGMEIKKTTELREFGEFNRDQIDAMYLRGLYYQNKDEILKQISIRLNKRAVETSYMEIEPHGISAFSKYILSNENMEENKNQRIENYQYLHRNILGGDEVQLVVEDISRIESAPLYFPIYCNDRKIVQKKLAMNHIYAPVLWPLDENAISVSDGVKYIYDHILCIPIDQRYNREHMKRVVEIINEEVKR